MFLLPQGPVGAVFYKPYFTTIFVILCTVFTLLGLTSRLFLDDCSINYTVIQFSSWFTAPLVHTNFWRFLFNIAGFWVLGVTLEGRFGFLRFMAVVIICVWVHSMASQVFLVWMDLSGAHINGYLRGLSGVNYALIGVAVIYAYNRSIWFWLHLVFVNYRFPVPILVLAGLYAAGDFTFFWFRGTGFDGLHFTGYVLGFGLAIFMTMAEVVPEIGANLIERAFGTKFARREIELNPKTDAELEAERREADRQEWQAALPNLIRLIDEGRFTDVHHRMAKLLANNVHATWDETLVKKLIQRYVQAQNWVEAHRYFEILHSNFPQQVTTPLWLSWAHVQLELGWPRKALRTLKNLQGVAVPASQKQVVVQLIQRAKDMVVAGTLEPDT